MGSIALKVMAEFFKRQHERKERQRRRAARQHLGLNPRWSVPVVMQEGTAPPRLTGDSYYHETQGGTRVRFPMAYCRVAKSARLQYCPSTYCVEVGKDWLGFAGT